MVHAGTVDIRTKETQEDPGGGLLNSQLAGLLQVCGCLRRSGRSPSPSAQSTPGRRAWRAAWCRRSLRDTQDQEVALEARQMFQRLSCGGTLSFRFCGFKHPSRTGLFGPAQPETSKQLFDLCG